MITLILILGLTAGAEEPPASRDEPATGTPTTTETAPPRAKKRPSLSRDAVIPRPVPRAEGRGRAPAPHTPVVPSPTTPPSTLPAAPPDPWRMVRPSSQLGGLMSLASATVLLLLLGMALQVFRSRLRPGATVTRATDAASFTLRIIALVLALALLASVLPGPLALLPLLLLAGAALGLGFASTAMLKDVVAGVLLRTEARALPGTWVRAGEARTEGRIRSIGLRATTLEAPEGHQLIVPNRRLLDGLATRTGRWLRATTELDLPDVLSPERLRRRLRELGMLSPWRAPGTFPTIEHAGGRRWTITVALIEPRFRGAHQEFMQELAARCPELCTVPAPPDLDAANPSA